MNGATADCDAPRAGEVSLVRVPLAVDLEPGDACLQLRGDDRPFALCGAWAGGGAVLGSEPTRVAGVREDPFELVERQPAVAGALEGWPGEEQAWRGVVAPDAVGGGWFGYLGYNLGACVERVPPPPPRPLVMPPFALAFYDHVLRLDAGGHWWFEALWSPARDADLRRRLAVLSRRLASPPRRRRFSVGTLAAAAPGASGYLEAVRECRERIAAGEIFQANLCVRLEATFNGSPLDLFADATARLQPLYGALVAGPWGAVCSLSPELFLRRRARDVVTRPIKGTGAREGVAPDREREALGRSEKDRAENVMIVDLMRNDLGRVCEHGSIRVDELAQPHPAPGVWHLVSTVTGRLRSEAGDAALLRACFPPGSVTGAPKIQAMRVISELESTGREAYTGAVGYASPIAGLELNVAIRTFELRGDRIWLGAGAGIVADSQPETELRECTLKARPIAAAAGARLAPASVRRASSRPPLGLGAADRPDPARGVFETILVRGGQPLDARAHLERLERSVEELYGCALPRDLHRRIAAESLRCPSARLRVAAVPVADGSVSTRVTAAALAPERPGVRAVVLHPFVVPGGLGAHKWGDRRLLEALASESGGVPLLIDLDGDVLEAAHANVFLAERDLLVTPPLDGRLLPGTVRADLIAATRRVGANLREEPLTLGRLAAGDAIFLTSSIRGVHPARLDGEAEPPAGLAGWLHAATGAVPYLVSSEPAERDPADTIAGTGGRSSSTRIT